MKKINRDRPLAMDGDSREMTEAIEALGEWRRYARRCSAYQLKVKDVSYYPGTEKIVIDGKSAEKSRGLDAWIALLERKYTALSGAIYLDDIK